MIDKNTFINLMHTTRGLNSGMHSLEQTLNCTFEDNFILNSVCSLVTIMTDAFFTDEELNLRRNFEGVFYYKETVPPIVYDYDTVSDLINHYCWSCSFGKDTEYLKDRLVVSSIDEGVVYSKDATTDEELYDLIVTYLTRNQNDKWECCRITINCTTK